jgi:transcription initiation factor TFIID subunit 9B
METEDKDARPRDALAIADILKSIGIEKYEPKVVNQLLEFMHRYVSETLIDAQDYALHAHRQKIEQSDLGLAIQGRAMRSFAKPPSRERLMILARDRNRIPIPPVPTRPGVLLPPERYCVIAQNYKTPIIPAAPPPPFLSTSTSSFPFDPSPFPASSTSPRSSFPPSSTSRSSATPFDFPMTQAPRGSGGGGGGGEGFGNQLSGFPSSQQLQRLPSNSRTSRSNDELDLQADAHSSLVGSGMGGHGPGPSPYQTYPTFQPLQPYSYPFPGQPNSHDTPYDGAGRY